MTKTNWNILAEEYTQRGMRDLDWNLGYLEVLNLLGKIDGKKILDYGCGSGKFTRKLVESGALVDAVDPTSRMIELALENDCTNIDYHLINDNDISFVESDSIDGVVATFVLCGIEELDKIKFIAGQIYEKLRKNSSFIILDPHPDVFGEDYVGSKKFSGNLKSGTLIETRLTGMEGVLYDYWKSKEDYFSSLGEVGYRIGEVVEITNSSDVSQFLVIEAKKV